ncbi:MAG: PAS domain S-box protein [Anaerolineae bacterium]|nr:PAS domain S-box protein [Anaerolineae bacterium]
MAIKTELQFFLKSEPVTDPRPTVLIVDDDPTNRQLLSMIVHREGCQSVEAQDGSEAVEVFQRTRPDAVLMDALMPLVDGFEACRRIKALPEGEHVPVLMVTSLDDDDSVQKAFAAGAVDYLNRPFRVDVVRHRLRVVLNAKKAEDALRESEANMRAIFNSGAMFLLLINRDGYLQTFNRVASRYVRTFLGVELFEGLHMADALEEQYRSWYLTRFHTALDGQSVVAETYLRRDALSEWVEFSFEPVFDDFEQVRGVCILGKIITERKQAEKALAQRTKTLETVNDISVDVAKTLELNDLLTKIARWIVESVGATSAYVCDYHPDNGTVMVMAEYFSPDANERERRSDLGTVYSIQEDFPSTAARIHDPRGYSAYDVDDPALPEPEGRHMKSYGANSVLTVPFRVEDQVVGFVEIWDSRRRRVFTEDEIDLVCLIANQVAVSIVNARLYTSLRDSREQLADFFENTSDLIQSISPDGHFTYVNRAWRDTLGYDAEELHPLTVEQVLHPDDKAAFMQIFQQFKAGQLQGTVNTETSYLTKEGRRVLLEGSLNFYTRQDQPLLRGIFHDVTARKEAEQELRRYARELEEINSDLDAYNHTVAHDLKNPLNLIMNYANLVEMETASILGEGTLDRIRKVQQYSLHMARMIDQMLRFAQLRKIDDVVKPVDMLPVIQHAANRFEDMIQKHEIELAIDSPLPPVMGVSAWMEEVFANFIGNAIKYRGENNPSPKIMIRGRQEGEMARYEIEDNGVGISPDDYERLFEMFTRLYTVKTDGFGLGLSIVHRIITRLKGQVGVESTPGGGSTFWFTLPTDASPHETVST